MKSNKNVKSLKDEELEKVNGGQGLFLDDDGGGYDPDWRGPQR